MPVVKSLNQLFSRYGPSSLTSHPQGYIKICSLKESWNETLLPLAPLLHPHVHMKMVMVFSGHPWESSTNKTAPVQDPPHNSGECNSISCSFRSVTLVYRFTCARSVGALSRNEFHSTQAVHVDVRPDGAHWLEGLDNDRDAWLLLVLCRDSPSMSATLEATARRGVGTTALDDALVCGGLVRLELCVLSALRLSRVAGKGEVEAKHETVEN
ncbi:unnamed protein product [Pleuronectes platessa]|uniref:Uncharacterized protein n=1 Tax=Pleuronectes platessa TaxID=8262 RepID=A0A9N7UDF2_PLEPL|nr:unnamed protein product [Pleuronectes platessa]